MELCATGTRPLAIPRSVDGFYLVQCLELQMLLSPGSRLCVRGVGNDADCKRSNADRKKGLKKMKSGFLQKQTSCRDISRD